jgi:hypothetical protein
VRNENEVKESTLDHWNVYDVSVQWRGMFVDFRNIGMSRECQVSIWENIAWPLTVKSCKFQITGAAK